MGSTATGELYTEEQFNQMAPSLRDKLGMVEISPAEQAVLQPMSLEKRKAWLKANKSKKPTRQQLNKRERKNKQAGRRK